jgi:hypothetical protein
LYVCIDSALCQSGICLSVCVFAKSTHCFIIIRHSRALDHSDGCRIVLRDTENPIDSYINANFIRGLDDAPDVYIAAQVRLLETWKQS